MSDNKSKIGQPVVMRAIRKFSEGAAHYHVNDEVVLAESIFLDEIKKGREERKQKNGFIESNNPTSSYLNHCVVVSCSENAMKAYKDFTK